jgi:hypothetical protein
MDSNSFNSFVVEPIPNTEVLGIGYVGPNKAPAVFIDDDDGGLRFSTKVSEGAIISTDDGDYVLRKDGEWVSIEFMYLDSDYFTWTPVPADDATA